MHAWTRPLSSMFYSTSHFILNDFKSTSALPFRACLANNARSAETPQERGAIRVKAKAGQMRTKCVNEGSEFDGWFNHFLTLPSWTVVSMFYSTSHFILNFKSTSGAGAWQPRTPLRPMMMSIHEHWRRAAWPVPVIAHSVRRCVVRTVTSPQKLF